MKLGVSFAELMKKKKGKKKRAPVPARDVRKPVVDHNRAATRSTAIVTAQL